MMTDRASKPIEQLAREICWLGFSEDYRKTSGFTKARYWKQLPESRRQDYRCDARRFAYLLDRLNADLLNKLLLMGIDRT